MGRASLRWLAAVALQPSSRSRTATLALASAPPGPVLVPETCRTRGRATSAGVAAGMAGAAEVLHDPDAPLGLGRAHPVLGRDRLDGLPLEEDEDRAVDAGRPREVDVVAELSGRRR